MKSPLIVAFLLLFFFSCKEHVVDPDGRVYEIPSTVGSYWKYSVLDSLSQEKDTVEANIISSISIYDGKVTRWKFKNLYTIDTMVVTFTGDTILAGLSSFSQEYKYILICPSRVGNEYNTIYGNMQVQAIENVLNEEKNYIGCYKIYQYASTATGINNITYWIKPGIGVVKAHRSFYAIAGSRDQEVTWDLLEYNILK